MWDTLPCSFGCLRSAIAVVEDELLDLEFDTNISGTLGEMGGGERC